jgi:hypothetical protein
MTPILYLTACLTSPSPLIDLAESSVIITQMMRRCSNVRETQDITV